MHARLMSSSAATLAATLVVPATAASAKDKPEISYFLPRTNVAVEAAMTLASCPSAPGELPEVSIQWTVTPQAAADPTKRVRVDVSSGFLAKRSNAFVLNSNGTLAAFNGKSEGQGAVVIGSALKLAATVAPLLGSPGTSGARPQKQDPDPQAGYYCSKQAAALLATLQDRKATIRILEDKVVAGNATAADLDLLDRRRKQRAAIVDLLTIKRSAKFTGAQDAGGSWTGSVASPEMLKTWFTDKPSEAATDAVAFDYTKIEGRDGFGVTINPVDPALAQLVAAGPQDLADKPRRVLVYRRPIQAKVVINDKACSTGECSETLDLDSPLLIGQWGALRELPVGDAGLFGSREAVAKFDAFGTPLEISYGSDTGGAGTASTIDAAGSTVTASADADTAALDRAVRKEELKQKLRDLRADEK